MKKGMKQKFDGELKILFNLSNKELEELREYDEMISANSNEKVDVFSWMKNEKYFELSTKSFTFYYISGRRVGRAEWVEVMNRVASMDDEVKC